MSTQSALALGGERTTGQAIRDENVMAAGAVANVVKSSLGPVGLDKMLVDEVGDVTVTNDGATILSLLEVEHPAAKVLVELAHLQDQEVGDGTTSVVIIAAELLKVANELVKDKIHPTTIISGFRLASKEAVKFIQEKMVIASGDLGDDILINAAKTSMSSKLIGPESDMFSRMVVDAITSVKRMNSKGKAKYPVKAVNIIKIHGGSSRNSRLINGYALRNTVASEACPKRIQGAKIACLDLNLHKARLKMGVQVLVTDPEKLAEIRQRESDMIKEKIQMILASGANVILTTQGIDDLSLKYFVEAGCMAVRRVDKDDLKRIARMTGGSVVMTLTNMEGEEEFDPKCVGTAGEVLQERICDDEFLVITEPKSKTSSSLILRGANDFMLDEMERAIHDALCVVKRVLESKSVVPGGGAVEAALSIYLEKFATTMGSREQLAIAEFAKALLVIPKTLVVNAAKDATELVAQLRAFHNTSQTKPDKEHLKWIGLDLIEGKIRDSKKAGVLEPTISKVKSLKFATEAAITILRIDDMIKMKKHEEQESAYAQAHRSGQLNG